MLPMDSRGIASAWGGWDSQLQRGSRNSQHTGAKKDDHPALVEAGMETLGKDIV